MDCGTILQSQPAVHIGFGGIQLRIDEQLGVELAIVEMDGDVGPRQKFAEHMDLPLGITHSQRALADEASKQIGQQTHVGFLRARRS